MTTLNPASSKQTFSSDRSHQRWIIVDADDTLWSTQELYETAKDEFHALLPPGLISRDELAAQLDRIDAEAVRHLGFGQDRFPRSMQATYRLVCEQNGMQPQDTLLQKIAAVGYRVFERSPQVYTGVPEALHLLRRQYGLVLLTKGDRQVQEDRIRTSGLGSYFDYLCIVDTKDADSYRQVLRRLQVSPASCWAVGNSARSDINPALEVGIRSVMIPNQSWQFEVERLRPGDALVADSLMHAAEYIMARDLKPALAARR